MISKRIKLRRFKASDLDNMVALESDPEVVKFSPLRHPLSREKSAERLQAMLDHEKSREPYGIWAAEFKDSGEFIGWFMLVKKPERTAPELGFMIIRSLWGQGLTTEAAQLLVEHAFNDLQAQAVVALTEPGNLASKKVLGKLGFHLTKTIQEFDKVLNRDIELQLFELKRS